jgi:hypothetical protein
MRGKVGGEEDEDKKTKVLSFCIICIPVVLGVSYVILRNVRVFNFRFSTAVDLFIRI